jgi:hypothetical protein
MIKLPVDEFPGVEAWFARLDENEAWKSSASQVG